MSYVERVESKVEEFEKKLKELEDALSASFKNVVVKRDPENPLDAKIVIDNYYTFKIGAYVSDSKIVSSYSYEPHYPDPDSLTVEVGEDVYSIARELRNEEYDVDLEMMDSIIDTVEEAAKYFKDLAESLKEERKVVKKFDELFKEVFGE